MVSKIVTECRNGHRREFGFIVSSSILQQHLHPSGGAVHLFGVVAIQPKTLYSGGAHGESALLLV